MFKFNKYSFGELFDIKCLADLCIHLQHKYINNARHFRIEEDFCVIQKRKVLFINQNQKQ